MGYKLKHFALNALKYTCQTSGNNLDVFGILKNPYFDPLHKSIALELKIILSF